MVQAGIVGSGDNGRVSPLKAKAVRSGSTVTTKKSELVEKETEEARRASVIEGDALSRLQEETAKNKQMLETLKAKLKREEDSRKHWQDIARKREEEVAELQKINEEVKAAVEAERRNANKY